MSKAAKLEAFIDGKWTANTAGATMLLTDPNTGKIVRESASCDANDVDRAVKASRAFHESGEWADRSPRERAQTLLRIADLVERDAELLGQLDSEDSGRPISECRDMDVPSAIESLRWFSEAVDKNYGSVSVTGRENLAFTEREPLGVVAAILPWNYPLANLAWKFGPALLSGNSLLVKPADATPRSALHLARLAEEAGLPSGALQVLPGPGETGAALAEHADVDAIFFTGSTSTGRKVLHAAASSNFKRTTLEMGGKSPQIVFADALGYGDFLFDNLIESAFLSMGQNCTAGSRILVHEDIADEVTERFVARAAALVVGDPADPRTQIGPLISRGAVERVEGLVRRAVALGARVLTGGERPVPARDGFHFRPTVLRDVAANSEIEQTEVFGPVVTISTFSDEAEGISRANNTSYGLAASVWTANIDRALTVARRVRAGTVSVNCYSEGDLSTPFGGFGQSGFGGKEKSLAVFDSWTQTKATWINLQNR